MEGKEIAAIRHAKEELFQLIKDGGQGIVLAPVPDSDALEASWDKDEAASECFLDIRFADRLTLRGLSDLLTLVAPVKGHVVSSATPGFVLAQAKDGIELGVRVYGHAACEWRSPTCLRIYGSLRDGNPVPWSNHQGDFSSPRAKVTITWSVGPVGERVWLLPHRFRYGHSAAFAVIDHADFDEPRFYEALLGQNRESGLAKSGVRISKTVFVAKGGPTACGATLQDPAWRRLVERWNRERSVELGLHMTRPLAATRAETLADLEACRDLAPSFWVDHGVQIPQGIWEQGANPKSEFFHLDLLIDAGVRTFWNYRDLWDDAPEGNLNYFSFQNRRLRPEFARLLGPQLFSPQALKAWINRGFSPRLGRSLRRLLQALRPRGSKKQKTKQQSWIPELMREVLHVPRQLLWAVFLGRSERTLSPVYLGGGIRGMAQQIRFFSSQLVREPACCWNRAAFGRLVQDGGLHLAHTYLGAPKRVPLVSYSESGTSISPVFAKCVGGISPWIASGELWSAGITELCESLILAESLRILCSAKGDVLVPGDFDSAAGPCAFLAIGSGKIEADQAFTERVFGPGRILSFQRMPSRLRYASSERSQSLELLVGGI